MILTRDELYRLTSSCIGALIRLLVPHNYPYVLGMQPWNGAQQSAPEISINFNIFGD